jgi:hypothetical protein
MHKNIGAAAIGSDKAVSAICVEEFDPPAWHCLLDPIQRTASALFRRLLRGGPGSPKRATSDGPMTPKAFHAPFGRSGFGKDAKRYEPLVGARYAQFNERTVGIKDSARERHDLFRCGAFGAACVAVHRSNIREWYPPRPE